MESMIARDSRRTPISRICCPPVSYTHLDVYKRQVDMVKKMFEEIAPKYANRNGGYTRIVKIGQRKGDGAMEVLIELV